MLIYSWKVSTTLIPILQFFSEVWFSSSFEKLLILSDYPFFFKTSSLNMETKTKTETEIYRHSKNCPESQGSLNEGPRVTGIESLLPN